MSSTRTWPTFYNNSNFTQYSVFRFHFDHCFHQLTHLSQSKSRTGNRMRLVTQPAIACSKLTIETLEHINFEHISHLVPVFLLLTLTR